MCKAPILIDNPYYGLDAKGLNYLHDCESVKMAVPCGHCPDCISLKQTYLAQRVQLEHMVNYLFMATFTYNNEMLPTCNFNGFTLYYPMISDVQNMLKRIRKEDIIGRPFKYIFVSEYGTSRHRPHFHAIISIEKYDDDDSHLPFYYESNLHDYFLSRWAVNIGTNRYPIYKPLCTYISNYKGRNFDFHFMDDRLSDNGVSDVSFYVSKYITKSSEYVNNLRSALKLNTSPETFKWLWFYFKPKILISKGFGSVDHPKVKEYVRKCIEYSAFNPDYLYPIFIDPVSGRESPLSPYLQKKFLNVMDAHTFYFRRPIFSHEINVLDQAQSFSNFDETLRRFDKVQKKLNSKELYNDESFIPE